MEDRDDLPHNQENFLIQSVFEKALQQKDYTQARGLFQQKFNSGFKCNFNEDANKAYFTAALNMDKEAFSHLKADLEVGLKKLSPDNQKTLSDSVIQKWESFGDNEGAERIKSHMYALDARTIDLFKLGFLESRHSFTWDCGPSDLIKTALERKYPEIFKKLDPQIFTQKRNIWVKTNTSWLLNFEELTEIFQKNVDNNFYDFAIS